MKRRSIRDGISLGLMIGVAKITYDWVTTIDEAVGNGILKWLSKQVEKLKEENEHAQESNDTTDSQPFDFDKFWDRNGEGPVCDCTVGTERSGESESSGESD